MRASSCPHIPARIEPLENRRLLAVLLPGFSEAAVTGNVSHGTTFEIAPDGKLFVVEQPGQIQVYSTYTPGNVLLQSNFLRDAQPPVNFSGEAGMIGLAFDPDYDINRYVYVHYSFGAQPFNNRISRFTANAGGDLALPGSEVVLIEIEPPTAGAHNGGALHFGPDGKLYIAVGDHASAASAQSITSLKGKILRINATPGDVIPDDNPTQIDGIPGTTSGIHRAIWAAGLRNPYTFAFQPSTGRMFINDVGQSSWEEINEGAPGRNYGWPETEGDFDPKQFPDFTRPLLAYPHPPGGTFNGFAIVGAAFYEPDVHSFPPDYAGEYFFADYGFGWIRRMNPITLHSQEFATHGGTIADLRVAPDGSLLYIVNNPTAGRVFRVAFTHVGPVVVGGEFQFDGFTLPDPPHRLRYAFSDDVSASLGTDDLVLENLTTGQPVAASHIALGYDASTNTATFTFPGFSDGILPDGNYRATLLAAGVTDPAGNPLPGNHVMDFFFLTGDANRDGAVNLQDFNVLAANFGQSPRTFTQGDFNYDGIVNLQDFNLLAARFGTILTGPGIATGSGAGVSASAGAGFSNDRNDWPRIADDVLT